MQACDLKKLTSIKVASDPGVKSCPSSHPLKEHKVFVHDTGIPKHNTESIWKKYKCLQN